MDSILSKNDNIKPHVTRMMFEAYPTSTSTQPKSGLPFECVTTDGQFVLDDFPQFEPISDEIVSQPYATAVSYELLDPTTNAIQQLPSYVNSAKQWDPGLSAVAEERNFDLQK